MASNPKSKIGNPKSGVWYVLTLRVDPVYYPWTAFNGQGRLQQLKTGTPAFPTSLQDLRYTYDAVGNVLSLQDYVAGSLQTQSFSYDALDRLLSAQASGGSGGTYGPESYTYNTIGNPSLRSGQALTRQTDARNQTICFYYDQLNRLRGKLYRSDINCITIPDPATYASYSVTYKYDETGHGKGYGRRTSTATSNPGTTVSYGFDLRGRVLTETLTLDSVNYTTNYRYDAADRLTRQDYPDGEQVSTSYTAQGLPNALWSGLGTYVSASSYNAAGQLKLRTLGNGLQTHYGYWGYNAYGLGDGDDVPASWGSQQFGRLWRICTPTLGGSCPLPPGGATGGLQDLRHAYDAVGNVTNLKDYLNASQLQTFTYDALDRLTTGYTDAVGQGQYNESYAYSGTDGQIGNLTSKTGVGGYAYNAPVSGCSAGTPPYKPHAVVQAGSYAFSYDCNGNVVQRNVGTSYTLSYDVEGRLVQVSGAASAGFTYDADGRRVKRSDANGTIVYVGNHYEKNTGTGVVTKYYSLGGQRVAMRVGSTLYYLFSDHLGSSSVSYRSDGQTVTQRYYPWGTVRPGPNNGLPTDYTFTGQKLDASTGLMYYGARYYDPALARFIQPDTIVPEPGNPQALNRYAYVYNNPLRYTDPSGHALEEDEGRLWHRRPDGSYQMIGLHPGQPFDSRDLTYYLYALINNNVDSPQILAISSLNTIAGINPVLGGFHMAALWKFASLVGTDKVWDVKDEIKDRLGEATRLCHAGGCVWVDYSTVGNIHFGFLAEGAGFPNWETHLGASYAEITDPAHDGDPYQIIHLNIVGRTVRGYFNPAYASAAFDDPKDRNAINFGQALYRSYGPHPTLRQIQALMTDYADTFALVSPPGDLRTNPDYPYHGDYFDHP